MADMIESGAVVTEQPEAHEEVTAESLFEDLSKEPETPPATEEQTEEAPEQEEELTPEQKRTNEVTSGLQAMLDTGWSKGEMEAFVADADVKKDIAEGKSVEQATIAYLRRALQAQGAKPAAKRSVPTVRSASPGRRTDSDAERIEKMTDQEFAEFSRRAEKAAKQGKRVLI